MSTPTIHWLGAGLSSVPGIIELAKKDTPVIVWNRSLEKAQKALENDQIKIDVRTLDWSVLATTIKAGDVIISMLPATLHLQAAQLCLDNKVHFVSSSYISPEMRALDAQAKQARLSFVNEVGLDPGIDHLLAHLLVDKYENSSEFSPSNQHYFRSYCGGFPKVANDFRYKFSWSPLGVLKALRSQAQWQEDGIAKISNAPWEALSTYYAKLGDGLEEFQAYPNRDSLPFKAQYKFGQDWDVQQFVRGTLRLKGWSDAWQYLFDELDTLSGNAADARLAELSTELEAKYGYEEGEPDRVVMCVELEVRRDNQAIWHQSYYIDSAGNENGQSMARLVSLPVSFAVQSVLNKQAPSGVSAAPSDPVQIKQWLDELADLGDSIGHHDHLV